MSRNWTLPSIGAAVITGAAAAAALAGTEGGRGYEYSGMPPEARPEEQAAIERFCPPDPPCHLVEVDSDLAAAAGGERPGESLVRAGRRAHECPRAADAFAAAGDPVHAFIGRCPSSEETAALVAGEQGSTGFEAQYEEEAE